MKLTRILGLIALAAAFGVGLPNTAVAQDKAAGAKKGSPEAGKGVTPPAPKKRKSRNPKKNAKSK